MTNDHAPMTTPTPARVPEPEHITLQTWYLLHSLRQRQRGGRVDIDAQTPLLTGALARVATKPAVLVDIGCGVGGFAAALAVEYPLLRVVGVDLDARAVAAAQELQTRTLLANLSFVTGDAARLPGLVGGVGVVTCVQTLHHFPNLAATLKAIYEALRPGGFFYFADFNREEMKEEPLVDAVRRLRKLAAEAFVREARLLRPLPGADALANHVAVLRACSLLAAYTPREVEMALDATGFSDIIIKRRGDGFEGVARRPKLFIQKG